MARDKQVKFVISIIDKMLHDTSKSWTNWFGRMETRTGVPRFKLLIVLLLAISVILIVFGANAMVLSNAIGLIYPAQATVSLMFSPPKLKYFAPAAAAAEAQNKKFTYWLTFSAVIIMEQVCGFILFLFPLYSLFRTLFLMWCSAPIRNNGVAFILDKVIYNTFKLSRQPFVNGFPSGVNNSMKNPQTKPKPLPCRPPKRSPQTTAWRSALRKRTV